MIFRYNVGLLLMMYSTLSVPLLRVGIMIPVLLVIKLKLKEAK